MSKCRIQWPVEWFGQKSHKYIGLKNNRHLAFIGEHTVCLPYLHEYILKSCHTKICVFLFQSFDTFFLSLFSRDPTFSTHHDLTQDPTSFQTKVSNVQGLVKSLKTYYENVLGQILVVRLPNAVTICSEPTTKESLDEMNMVLLLILGAAVQCNQNETVIGSIKNLPTSVQHSFVSLIQEVTENPLKIWPSDLCDPDKFPDENKKDEMYTLLIQHLRMLVQERDKLSDQLIEMTLKQHEAPLDGSSANTITRERNHLALEVSELKAKIRGMNQEVQEKTDLSTECKEEMEKYITKCSKLRQENLELTQKAREARTLKDELDVLRERAQKVHTLEAEIQVYKDKICQNESLKSRVEEVREENKILVEHKQMLEEQLESSRKRIQTILTLENELFVARKELGVCQVEMESDKRRIEELQEENSTLLSNKSSMSESRSLMAEMDSNEFYTVAISEQVMNKDSLTVHKLELENQRLRSELDDVKLNGLREQSEKLLELEQELKRKDLTLQQVESERSKDYSHFITIESELHQSTNKVQQLEQVVNTLKEADRKNQIEKDTIIENLHKQIDSLRKRQEQSANEQLRILEDENIKLVTANTLFEANNSKFLEEKKQLTAKLCEFESKAEESTEEKEQLSKELKTLRLEHEQLTTAKETAKESNTKEIKKMTEKFQKSNDKLKKDISDLFLENSKLKLNLKEMDRQMEFLRIENKRLPSLESEREDLMDKVNKLTISINSLTVSSKKVDEQEQRLTSVTLENHRLLRQVESSQKKVREVEKENATIECENQKMQSQIENLKSTANRVEG